MCILNTLLLLLLNTHTKCVEIWEEKIVKLGRVMEASGLGGDCLKSMFMEMIEFQKMREDHYFQE